ncbi:hypothetical protein QFZ30_003901 [Arthrobacter pascens]|uniref:hypothetical protein n=1 Tax=Arthrobacter pascens TaxID=1677 RepID=UPI002794A02B|nr:hypothetical protein [Arthrobacter pascens]MDQ0680519.1 hypothetical protein [Arthrobacter pascens]
MVSLIVLIAAALLTSASAAAYVPQSAADAGARAGAGAKLRRRFKNQGLVQLSAGILALGSILVAVHVQLGSFR